MLSICDVFKIKRSGNCPETAGVHLHRFCTHLNSTPCLHLQFYHDNLSMVLKSLYGNIAEFSNRIANKLTTPVPLYQLGLPIISRQRILITIIIRVLCPKTGPSLQAEKPSCSSAEGRSSTANSGTKTAVLLGI